MRITFRDGGGELFPKISSADFAVVKIINTMNNGSITYLGCNLERTNTSEWEIGNKCILRSVRVVS